jgi:hypothetical protein
LQKAVQGFVLMVNGILSFETRPQIEMPGYIPHARTLRLDENTRRMASFASGDARALSIRRSSPTRCGLRLIRIDPRRSGEGKKEAPPVRPTSNR